MAASYPNSVKSFTDIVDGTTDIEAVNMNTAYDEIEAIQTALGALGATQANTDSFKNLLSKYRKNCQVEYKSATEIYVRAGELCIPDASNNIRFRRVTSDITVTWSDIDTGSEASSTTYYVYAIGDASGTEFTVKISTNSSTPSGSPTFYRKIGQFYNDGSSDIDDQRVLGIIDVDDAPKVRKRTLQYTGDGAATLAITGFGFQPKKVEVFNATDNGQAHGIKTDQDGTKTFYNSNSTTGYKDDHVISLDSDGITVGDGSGDTNRFNLSGKTYTVTAETW